MRKRRLIFFQNYWRFTLCLGSRIERTTAEISICRLKTMSMREMWHVQNGNEYFLREKTHEMGKKRSLSFFLPVLFFKLHSLSLSLRAIPHRSNFVATCVPLYAKWRKIIGKNADQKRIKTRWDKNNERYMCYIYTDIHIYIYTYTYIII